MQVYDMQGGNKTDMENHEKAGDARRKIGNRGPAAYMGVKACVGGNKMRKATTETKPALKNNMQSTVKGWTLDRPASYVGHRYR